ncbi:MAG TPA: hypothetical protein VLJ40_13615 [Arthrobacter sp.]|nr:hypothetical protein [Arthrobacter sp.]
MTWLLLAVLLVAAADPPVVALPAGPHHPLANGPADTEPKRQALTLDQLAISRT